MAQKENLVVDLTIKKEQTKVFLEVKLDQQLEDFFKLMSKGQIAVSKRWFDENGKGLEFYSRTDDVIRYREELIKQGLHCFDDFGDGLLRGGASDPNIALLRIVGSAQGKKVELSDILSFEDTKVYADKLSAVVGQIYKLFINNGERRVRITVSYESKN